MCQYMAFSSCAVTDCCKAGPCGSCLRTMPLLSESFMIILQIRMNVTLKEASVSKQHPNDTKISMKPALFQMKHYSPNGIMEQLAYMLIRPPRFIYNPEILKPSRRIGQRFTVETFLVPFELTLYKQEAMRYVILYLHGNGSSSFQGTLFLSSVPDGVGLACFDFSGCGNRTEGEFITLGQSQSKDVDVAAAFLKGKGYEVVGWGRSMGAVSLLMSSQCDIMIADSAYSNLSILCKQSSSKFLPPACCCIFNCFFPCVFACIQCKVNKLAGLTIDQMNIMKRLREIPETKQICFIHGEEDTLIPPHHADKLYQSFPGRKMLVMFEGTHNSTRPAEVIEKCYEFIESGLEESRRKTGKLNTKIMEMANIDNPISPFLRLPKINKTDKQSIISTQATKSSMPLASKQEYTSLQGDQSHEIKQPFNFQIKQQYCQVPPTIAIPENFCQVINSQDFQKVPESSESQQGPSRKARMTELLFARKRE